MKRLLSALLSLCMVMTMAPMAFAVDTETPSAASISINGDDGTPYTSDEDGAALRMDIPNDVVLDIASIGMVTTEAVELGNVSGAGANTVYADGENLKISLNVKGVPYTVTAKMNTTDNINWTGEGDVPEIDGVTDLPIGALANELGNTDISVAEGVLVAGDRQSVAAKVHINQDAEKVYLYLYPASAAVHTVTYSFGSNSYTFAVPDGSALVDAQVPVLTGQTFSGWCTDADCENATDMTQAVTADMTLYGKYTAEAGTTSFDDALTKLLAGDTSGLVEGALPISDATDFEAFVARAEEVPAGQLVRLQNNIVLTGKTYSAISDFKGDFDGGNHTITGGTFTAVAVGNEDCAGMFAKLGAYNGRGQRVANLTLNGVQVNASGADYAGILVGNASGTETSSDKFVQIQNVQVIGGSVSGRTAGGIAGFIHWTTVQYCTVTDGTKVSGTVNGGGIAGISYRNIINCGATVTPTALPLLGKTGGIVGKNLEGGYIDCCWTTMNKLAGSEAEGSEKTENVVTSAMAGMPEAYYTALGFSSDIWDFPTGGYPTIDVEAAHLAF